MKRSAIVGGPVALILTVILTATVLTVSQAVMAGKPKIRATPETFDFGYVPEGHTVFHRYWLANDGTDTLFVELVKPQCGCTTVPLPKDRLAPSDSVPLDLSFESKNMKGRVNKAVRIWSNDSTQYPATIYFTADIADSAQLISVTPSFASLTNIDKPEQIMELSNNSKQLYRVGFATPPPAFLHCELSSDSLPSGATVTLRMTPGAGCPLGEYRTSLTLWLDGNIPCPVTIPVRGVGYVQ